LAPGVVSVALSVWSVHVHGTERRWRPWEAEFTCPCCDAGWSRDTLQEAMSTLPPRAATELRARIERLDDVLLGRTVHDPAKPSESAWWHRRC